MNAEHFWIHCNICAQQFDNISEMFLLNCQHVLCKECMKHTDRGTNCPMHKRPIRFCSLKDLPQKQKNYFQPNICRLFDEPVKMVKFQRDHQMHLFKMMESYRIKHDALNQESLKAKERIEQMTQYHRNLVDTRQKMVKKLQEIYSRQQNPQSQQQIYRNTHNSIGSANSSISFLNHTTPSTQIKNSSGYPIPPSSIASNQSLVGNFFQPNAACFKPNVKKDSGSSSSNYSMNHSSSQSNHSSRAPFFL